MIAQLPEELVATIADSPAAERARLGDLLPKVYHELRDLARTMLNQERQDHTLQATALVHEAYLRLVRARSPAVRSRADFMRLAATVMRHILMDHARRRNRIKRGGNSARVPLHDTLAMFEEHAVDLVALDDALRGLAKMNPRQCHIVEMRFFAGLTIVEIAEILGVSSRSVDDLWRHARAWLLRELTAE